MGLMNRLKPPPKASQQKSVSELLWRALLNEFEAASQDALSKLLAGQEDCTQDEQEELVRAELRRSKALSDMLQFLVERR